MRRCWLCASVVPLCLALAVTAGAQATVLTAPTPSTATASTTEASNPPVHIVVVGSDGDVEALKGAVATWRLGNRPVLWRRVSSFEPMSLLEDGTEGITCTIDLSAGRTAKLYFKNSGTQRYLVRSLETSGSLSEMDKEAVGQAVELSLLALLEDQATGLTKEDTQELLAPPSTPPSEPPPLERPPPEPVPEAPASKVSFLEASLGYQLLPLLDGGSWVHGPSIALMHSFGGTHRFAMGVATHVRFEERWQSEWATLSLSSKTIWLQGEWRPLLVAWDESDSEGQRLGFGVAAGMELLRVEPLAGDQSEGVTLTESRLRVEPNLRLQLDSLSTVTSWLVLRAGVLLEVASGTDYEVSVSGRSETVFRSLRMRPGVGLGATFVWD